MEDKSNTDDGDSKSAILPLIMGIRDSLEGIVTPDEILARNEISLKPVDNNGFLSPNSDVFPTSPNETQIQDNFNIVSVS